MNNAATTRSTDLASFQQLLEDFRAVSAHASDEEYRNERNLLVFGDDLFRGFRSAIEKWRVSQEQTADDFNLLAVMNITERETIHSRVLAWLLDNDLSHLGTHAQGSLGFQKFLAETKLPSSYASPENDYWVRTEVRGDNSIIDIEVACRRKFLIHIENKIWAPEGDDDQTVREWGDMHLRAGNLKIPKDDVRAFFLTLDGKPARESNFTPITWFAIANVFERFAEEAKPPEVRLFCNHYARSMRLISGQDRLDEEGQDAESNFQ
jgi:hypothetical protein